MEAPVKIYLVIDPVWGGMSVNYNRNDTNNIEYTRTDAFIEKACVKLKKLMYDNLMFQDRLHREEIIDNFVEDLKKAMEE